MFTNLPVGNKSMITSQADVGLGFAPVIIVVLLVFVGLAMYKLGQRNKVKELRDKALDQLLAKSGITLIEASALSQNEVVEPAHPDDSAEPTQPASPQPVMEAVLPQPDHQDGEPASSEEEPAQNEEEPVQYAPTKRSRVFIGDSSELAEHPTNDLPHQSEEDWAELERLEALRSQEITPEMDAAFEAMAANNK